MNINQKTKTMKKTMKKTMMALCLLATMSCTKETTTSTLASAPAPTACFTVSASAVKIGETFACLNCSSNATNYQWDDGDGSPVSTSNDRYIKYNVSGTFAVKLTALGAGGKYDTKTIYVTSY